MPLKMKVIEGNLLAMKLKSGAYIWAEKIGAYYNELALDLRFGFKISLK
jgi:hypothetical protein